jgi:ABC-type transporter Mla MlaB component
MLKITTLTESPMKTVLRMEGRLVGAWVIEARTMLQALLTEQRSIAVDLTDLTFADRNGVALLNELRHQQVALLNCAPFINEQFK